MIAGKKCRKDRNKIHTIELRQKVHNLDKHDADYMQVTPSHTDHICKSHQVHTDHIATSTINTNSCCCSRSNFADTLTRPVLGSRMKGRITEKAIKIASVILQFYYLCLSRISPNHLRMNLKINLLHGCDATL